MDQALSNAENMRLLRHMVGHASAGTMDLADEILEVPASYYTDPELFERELKQVHRRLPQMLAPSCELPKPGDFKTMEVAGAPVLMVRGQDGVARSFLNSCTHRGAAVAVAEHGNTKRFTCQYHGWTFGQKGELVGVASAEDFGAVDKSCLGLKELPTAERAGLIFVTLDPHSSLDIDDYLCGFDELLELYDLKNWHYFSSRHLDGPNWKLVLDASVDFYHVPVLHKTTLAVSGLLGNRALPHAYGPHQRMLNPDLRAKQMSETPESEWNTMQAMSGLWSIFPSVSISNFNYGGRGVLLMQMLPGTTVGTSQIHQLYLMEHPPESEEYAVKAHEQFDLLKIVVADEDNFTGFTQQKALQTGLVSRVLYGRNEGGGQAFHRWVQQITDADDQELRGLFRARQRHAAE